MNLTCRTIVDEHTGLILAQSIWSILEDENLQITVKAIAKYTVSYQIITWNGGNSLPTVSEKLKFTDVMGTQVKILLLLLLLLLLPMALWDANIWLCHENHLKWC